MSPSKIYLHFSHIEKTLKKAVQELVEFCMVFLKRFYEINQRNMKEKTYDDFCNSSYYNAFVKFGKHTQELNALEPSKFIEYVIKNNIPVNMLGVVGKIASITAALPAMP